MNGNQCPWHPENLDVLRGWAERSLNGVCTNSDHQPMYRSTLQDSYAHRVSTGQQHFDGCFGTENGLCVATNNSSTRLCQYVSYGDTSADVVASHAILGVMTKLPVHFYNKPIRRHSCSHRGREEQPHQHIYSHTMRQTGACYAVAPRGLADRAAITVDQTETPQ